MANPYATLDAYWDTPLAVCPEDEPRQLRELVRYATLAPNAHNTQPWQFAIDPGAVRIFPDLTRSMPVGDPDDRELWISIGCSLETLVLAARRVGYEPTVTYFPDDEPEDAIRVTFAAGAPVTDDPLFDAIARRHSNRRAYDGKPIPAGDLEAVEAATEEAGVRALVRTDSADVERVIEVIRSGFAWQRSSTEFRRELASWIRFSKGATLRHRDGLATRAIGRPQLPDPIGRLAMRFLAVSGLEEREIVGKVRSSSAVLMLVSDDNDRTTWVRAGRALARVKLRATERGLVCAHLNNNWQWEATRGLAQDAFSLGSAVPHVTIRLGYAPALPHSPRRPVDAVLRHPNRSG